jgi:hypothetical protein
MAHYYLDCEFNGYKGELISLALVRSDGKYIYLADLRTMYMMALDPWVKQHVVPIVETEKFVPIYATNFATFIEEFFKGDEDVIVNVDWPDDIKYLSEILLTGPGTMINIPRIAFVLHRVDAYPSTNPDLVQHNALADAFALQLKILEDHHSAIMAERTQTKQPGSYFGYPPGKISAINSPDHSHLPQKTESKAPFPMPPVRPELLVSAENYFAPMPNKSDLSTFPSLRVPPTDQSN